MEDAMTIIKMDNRQDLRDPPLELVHPRTVTKLPRVSTTSSRDLSPQPNFVLSHLVDRPGPSSEDTFGSSVALSPRPIMPRLIANRVGPVLVDACSGGRSIDIRPNEGETNSTKKKAPPSQQEDCNRVDCFLHRLTQNEAVFRFVEHRPELLFEKVQLRAYEWLIVHSSSAAVISFYLPRFWTPSSSLISSGWCLLMV
ncbi:hypothetical protein Ancab_022830 [Ancistrocladus abbreviatus]